MGWKKHPLTIYLVSWDEQGVVKIGTTFRQRWRKFTLRGARLVATWPLPTAYEFELAAQMEAGRRWQRAFTTRDAAIPFLGADGAGWRECYRTTPDEALAMIRIMRTHDADASCERTADAPSLRHEHGRRRTDGRTENRVSVSSKLTVCTRVRTGEFS